MRTTVDIEDDILEAARELAESRGTTIGRVLSELARRGLEPTRQPAKVRNGVPLLPRGPRGSRKPTMALVTACATNREPAGPPGRERPGRALRSGPRAP